MLNDVAKGDLLILLSAKSALVTVYYNMIRCFLSVAQITTSIGQVYASPGGPGVYKNFLEERFIKVRSSARSTSTNTSLLGRWASICTDLIGCLRAGPRELTSYRS